MTASTLFPVDPPVAIRQPKTDRLVLARLLDAEARSKHFDEHVLRDAHEILEKWADLESSGRLRRLKETQLQGDFLAEILGAALGYKRAVDGADEWHYEQHHPIAGQTPDAVLGHFRQGIENQLLGVVELKGPTVHLDRDRSNGRTAVDQCWDYLVNTPSECRWGIVSNYVSFRLYERSSTKRAYEHFTLQSLRDFDTFRQFYVLFHRQGLIDKWMMGPPRAVKLLEQSRSTQREIGDKLYDAYSTQRLLLIEHLHRGLGHPLNEAVEMAQRLFDRVIFIAFCEDRGLLPARILRTAYEQISALSAVTNPRWQNFKTLFRFVDQGGPVRSDEKNGRIHAYNGGLFAVSPADDLELDDRWTTFFNTLGTYNFADEVNLDVLGHLFERSITELEKLKESGLFGGNQQKIREYAQMPQSAKRKRLGIYYTPPELTSRIVQYTVDELIDERFAAEAMKHGVSEQDARRGVAPDDPAYWQSCLAILRNLKIVDPACGSGAFLFQAYNSLEQRYSEVIGHFGHTSGEQPMASGGQLTASGGRQSPDGGGSVSASPSPSGAATEKTRSGSARRKTRDVSGDLRPPLANHVSLADQIPYFILQDNLYGVDLSPEAVEITQLALWIRSAPPGQTLARLSENIVHGNSLVHDPEVHPAGFDWRTKFPTVFDRDESGFDCVIGNPPWERIKLQEREFFSLPAPEIATSTNAAKRRKLVARLESDDPALYARYQEALESASALLTYCRKSDAFPLTGRGDINTYAVFAELAYNLVAPHGRVGLLTPSGIASDKTTKDFFAAIAETNRLRRLYDFENRLKKFFPDIDNRFKFCILNFGGAASTVDEADFAFFLHRVEELEEKKRHVALSGHDIKLLNPNTRTCPIFRTRRDAQITKAIYRRVPVLIDRNRKGPTGNPWGITFKTMFHQTNDAELFREPDDLKAAGFKLVGNRWKKGKQVCLPVYEAKMVQMYDHRAAAIITDISNWVRQGQPQRTTVVDHKNPEYLPLPRFWIDKLAVEQQLDGPVSHFVCFKDVTSPTNQRTMIAAMAPVVGVVNSAPIILTHQTPRLECCLLANLNSTAYDFIVRQKISNVHLNFFIVEQVPTFAPSYYAEPCRWQRGTTLETWFSERVLKLTCTAEDMLPLAEACGFTGGSFQAEYGGRLHKWDEAERAVLMAELDAAFFHLYGIDRDDAEYILSTFKGIHDRGTLFPDHVSQAEFILRRYAELSCPG